jgi:hypothetical protein
MWLELRNKKYTHNFGGEPSFEGRQFEGTELYSRVRYTLVKLGLCCNVMRFNRRRDVTKDRIFLDDIRVAGRDTSIGSQLS